MQNNTVRIREGGYQINHVHSSASFR